MNRRSYFLIAGPLGHPTLLPLLNHGNNMTSPSDLP